MTTFIGLKLLLLNFSRKQIIFSEKKWKKDQKEHICICIEGHHVQEANVLTSKSNKCSPKRYGRKQLRQITIPLTVMHLFLIRSNLGTLQLFSLHFQSR